MMKQDVLTVFILGLTTATFFIYGLHFRYFTAKTRVNSLLSFIFFVNTFFLFKDILYYTDFIIQNEHWYNTLLTIDNWMIALNSLYIFEILKTGSATLRKMILYVLGFVLFTLIYAWTGKAEILGYLQIYSLIYVVILLCRATQLTLRYKREVKDLHSNLERTGTIWLWISMFLFIFLFSLWQVIFTDKGYSYDMYYYLAMAVAWTIIAYKTEKQILIKQEEQKALSLVKEQVKSRFSESSFHFSDRLAELNENGYFCNHPQITLGELATELGTNTTTLSYYFNTILKQSFYDYINDSRLEKSVKLLLTEQNMTQQDLYIRSGFNSLSTFRRAFQKKYGMSTTAYRKERIG